MDNLYELKKTYEAGPGQTDCFGLLRPSALIGFMQDAATVHAGRTGFSREELIERGGIIWLMARQRYFLSRPIKSKETIAVTTWHRKTAGCIWYRDFEFEVSGEIVGGANSLWIMADAETKKMVSPSVLGKTIATMHPTRNDGPDIRKIKLPEHLEYAGAYTVRYSDLDINRHLNNVKVCDILLNALPLEDLMQGKYISEFQVGYLKESRPKDELALYASNQGGCVFVTGECRKERHFESFYALKRIPPAKG